MQYSLAPALTVIALAMIASSAMAQEAAPFSIGPRPIWFVAAGPTGGATAGWQRSGGFIGGEISVVRLVSQSFVGAYADAFYDFAVKGTYITLGPEGGWIRRSKSFPVSIGVDGGGAVRISDRAFFGGTGRLFVSFVGLVSLYARYTYIHSNADRHNVFVGAAIKFPLGPGFGPGAASR